MADGGGDRSTDAAEAAVAVPVEAEAGMAPHADAEVAVAGAEDTSAAAAVAAAAVGEASGVDQGVDAGVDMAASAAGGQDAAGAGEEKPLKATKRKRGGRKKGGPDSAFKTSGGAAGAGGAPRRGAQRRASAKARQLTRAAPEVNASLYVGYVEDGESVDMIMRKFQALEQMEQAKQVLVQAETAIGGEEAETLDGTGSGTPAVNVSLNDDELQELFHKTSYFTLKSTQRDDAMDLAIQAGYAKAEEWGWEMPLPPEDLSDDDEGVFFDDDDGLWDDIFGKGARKEAKRARRFGARKGRGSGSRRAKRPSVATSRLPGEMVSRSVTRLAYVTDSKGEFVTAVKRIRKVDPRSIRYQKAPNPLPLSWALRIKPYVPQEERPSLGFLKVEVPDMLQPIAPVLEENGAFGAIARTETGPAAPEGERACIGDYQAIVMNPPWYPANEADVVAGRKYVTPEDLRKLDLGSDKLLHAGFIFIWVETHVLLKTVTVLESIGYFYVENACWVKKNLNNTFAEQSHGLLTQSKQTLLICRRGDPGRTVKYRKIEIRHQRTPDTFFDFVRDDFDLGDGLGLMEGKPNDDVYKMVETLCPEAVYNPKNKRGAMLELWASPAAFRQGWTCVVQGAPSTEDAAT